MEYEVIIPKGVELGRSDGKVTVKGPKGELSRSFVFDKIKVHERGDKLVLSMEKPKTQERAYLGTTTSHIKNMIEGVTKGFVYKLKIVYAHFPINASVEGNRFVIRNFSGEKKPRFANIIGETKVKIEGQEVFVEGINLEEVSQTAANIEKATRIKHKDPRVFGDGIFITSKGE